MTQEEISAYKSEVFGKAQSPIQAPPAEQIATLSQETPAETPVSTESTSTPVTEINTSAPEETEEVIDAVTYLKQQLGYDDWEIAKQDIDALRKIKETASTPEEIKFANEQSKKLYEYLKEGKEDEVAEYVSARKILKDVESKSDDDKLKLWIKMQNPLFNDKHAEEEFAETYSINEEEIDPSKLERTKLKLEQRKRDDIAKANQYFEQFKTKLELPEIQRSAPANADEAYQQYQSTVQTAQQVAAAWDAALAKTPDKITFKQSFNDEANKMKFDVEYISDNDGYAKAFEAAKNYQQFLANRYYEKDGSPKSEQLVKDIYALQNLDKYTAEAVKQAVNATKSWLLKTQKNISDNGQRNYNVAPETDVQKLKKQVFG